MLSFSPYYGWDAVRNSKNIRAAVRAARQIFKDSGIPEPAASAEYLALASFPNMRTRRATLTDSTRPDRSALDAYIHLCKQRERKRVPIQYLVGEWDFHHITLLVRPPVLIPRPETEELVEHVLHDIQETQARILDIGCGSGAILLATLNARPGWSGVGLDVVEDAVALSRDNAKLLGIEARAVISAGTVAAVAREPKFDALVSNPPYIPAEHMKDLEPEVQDHEDFRALCGGEDGLDVIREIMDHAPRVVKEGGSVWLEVDSTQPEQLENTVFAGMQFINKFADCYGKPRFCHWQVTSASNALDP